MNIKIEISRRLDRIIKVFPFLLFLIFMQSCSTPKQATAGKLRTLDISQFGFVGNGRTNNSDAFKRLSKYLQGKKNIRIKFKLSLIHI